MKALIKTPQEISLMREGGEKLSDILDTLVKITVPGTSLTALEEKAQELIKKSGGTPSFSRVPGYRWATCINLNDGLVHGIPTGRLIQEGDLVTIDIGLFYKNFHTDTSTSFLALSKGGKSDPEKVRFLEAGRVALEKALSVIKPGNRVGHISQAIQETVESFGYSCSYELTGHGVGRELHEYPPVPCVQETALEYTPLLKTGMTLAIEVIYAQGKPDIYTDDTDKWTISTKDGKISAVFEKTIAVTSDGYLRITP